MTELVYPPVIMLCRTLFKLLGTKITITGHENVPTTGGAVLASNHVSYLDFIFVGMGARPAGRLTRFMAKQVVFEHPVSGPLMRGMKHIPVDRHAGTAAFRQAMKSLKSGEVIGIFPEGTTSRSFTVKELKPGAIRMAQSAKVPLIPVVVWGGQRMYTRGRPRKLLSFGRHIYVVIGPPLPLPRETPADELNQKLRETLQTMITKVQQATPEQPTPGVEAWWHPAELGGSAPSLAEADAMDQAQWRIEDAARAAQSAD